MESIRTKLNQHRRKNRILTTMWKVGPTSGGRLALKIGVVFISCQAVHMK